MAGFLIALDCSLMVVSMRGARCARAATGASPKCRKRGRIEEVPRSFPRWRRPAWKTPAAGRSPHRPSPKHFHGGQSHLIPIVRAKSEARHDATA